MTKSLGPLVAPPSNYPSIKPTPLDNSSNILGIHKNIGWSKWPETYLDQLEAGQRPQSRQVVKNGLYDIYQWKTNGRSLDNLIFSQEIFHLLPYEWRRSSFYYCVRSTKRAQSFTSNRNLVVVDYYEGIDTQRGLEKTLGAVEKKLPTYVVLNTSSKFQTKPFSELSQLINVLTHKFSSLTFMSYGELEAMSDLSEFDCYILASPFFTGRSFCETLIAQRSGKLRVRSNGAQKGREVDRCVVSPYLELALYASDKKIDGHPFLDAGFNEEMSRLRNSRESDRINFLKVSLEVFYEEA